jgi:hypothetical protein
VAVLACLALSRPASASGPVDEFDHPNVTWYDRPAAEAAAPEALSVQTGTVDPTEGCIVSAPSVSADDYSEGVTVTNTEVAYDPDACKSLYLRVESADEQSSSSSSSSAQTSSEASASDYTDLDTDEDKPSEITVANAGYVWPRRVFVGTSEWEDPLELDVNKVYDSINYAPAVNCASYSAGSWHDRMHWLDETGWDWLYHDMNKYWHCDRVAAATYARFNNYLFCDPNEETRTRMWPNRVSGYPDASLHMVHEPAGMSKTGDCAGLLHSEATVKTTYTGNSHDKGYK